MSIRTRETREESAAGAAARAAAVAAFEAVANRIRGGAAPHIDATHDAV
jgi:hypothetical protein